MLMRKCLLAMLILMLLNLNTGYTDTDADLCIRIMSLCYIKDLAITVQKLLAKFKFSKKMGQTPSSQGQK